MSEPSYVAPSRQGKKSLTVWIDPDLHKSLKVKSAQADEPVQDIVERAIRREVEGDGKRKK